MQRSLREQNVLSITAPNLFKWTHKKTKPLTQGILHISATFPFRGTMIDSPELMIFTAVGTGIPEDHSEQSRFKGQYYADQHQSKMCRHSLKEGLFTVVGKKNKTKFLTVLLLSGQGREHISIEGDLH